VCDLETSRMGAPYIYDISRLRVKMRRLLAVNVKSTHSWDANKALQHWPVCLSAAYWTSNSTHFREISWHFTFFFRTSLHNQADYDGITQMSDYLGRTRKPSNYRLAMPMKVCPVHNNDSADCSLACLSILNVINKSIYIIIHYASCSRSAVCQQQMQICDIQFLTAVSPGIQIFWDMTPCL